MNSPAAATPEPALAKIYHPGSLTSRLMNAYLARVEMIIATITDLFRTNAKDNAQRETLAKKLKEASALKTEIAACRNSIALTCEFLQSEISRCNGRNAIDIHDIYRRDAVLGAMSAGAAYAFDVRALAKEYLRASGARGDAALAAVGVVASTPNRLKKETATVLSATNEPTADVRQDDGLPDVDLSLSEGGGGAKVEEAEDDDEEGGDDGGEAVAEEEEVASENVDGVVGIVDETDPTSTSETVTDETVTNDAGAGETNDGGETATEETHSSRTPDQTASSS